MIRRVKLVTIRRMLGAMESTVTSMVIWKRRWGAKRSSPRLTLRGETAWAWAANGKSSNAAARLRFFNENILLLRTNEVKN